MNAFHVFWTPSDKERSFSDYFILTLILSAMQWKLTNVGKLTFYGDRKTVEFLEKYRLTPLWDQCDGDTLDQTIDKNHYDTSTFVTIGKFAAFLKEKAPCAMVDVDLVIWKNLSSLLKGKKAAFTHWEYSRPDSIWYPGHDRLPRPDGYQFHPTWDFHCLAVNTSFMYFSEDKLKEYYVNAALEYMYDNKWTKELPPNSAIMFVEQKLLAMCLNELNLQEESGPLIDIIWNSDTGNFRILPTNPDGWKFFEWDNNSLATHIWIAKQTIEQNEKYRTYMCCRAIEMILAADARMAETLEGIESVRKYLELLERYGCSDRIINAGAASRVLYNHQ